MCLLKRKARLCLAFWLQLAAEPKQHGLKLNNPGIRKKPSEPQKSKVQQKICARACILMCFFAWGPPRECPGDHAGMGTSKSMKKLFGGAPFLCIFMTGVATFVATVFQCFLNLTSANFLIPKAPTRSSWRIIRTPIPTHST